MFDSCCNPALVVLLLDFVCPRNLVLSGSRMRQENCSCELLNSELQASLCDKM